MKRPEKSKRLQDRLNEIKRSNSLSQNDDRRGIVSRKLLDPRRLTVGIGLSVVLMALMFLPAIQRLNHKSVSAFDESIATFASSDCTTPKAAWDLGQTACAVANGVVGDRRIAWVAPNGAVAQFSNSFTGTGSDTYAIPTTGNFAQVGTWTVQTIDGSGVGFADAEFVVRDPANASVDLGIGNFGPFEVSAGNNINYRVEVTNKGPDDAQNVVLTSSVPGGTTFVSEAQTSGPAFTCTTPTVGSGSGTISCTIATLPANAVAVFTIAFNVNADATDGSTITSSSSVSSDTHELQPSDNTASSSATVSGTSTNCTLNCPGNVDANNDANQCSAVVTYTTPTASGNCGTPPDNTVTCNPPSGSPFPIGATAVSCSTQSGGACSFTVTVHDTRTPVTPTITCPGNVSVGEDAPNSGQAIVNYTAPTTTGNCVNTVCVPPSGSVFFVGSTPVSCTATDSANNSVSCGFTVTVTSGAACILTCPGDVTRSAASGQCSAVVNYTAPSTSGNCGTVTCTPPAGSTFSVGSTAVTCSSDQGPSCSFTVTVVAAAPPTITTCASNKAVPVDSNCEGVIPNLVSEVVVTGCNVTVSQSPAAGSIVPAGIYIVTITAENSAGQATCTATVKVDTTPPVITTCPAGTSASADASCQAAVPNVIGGVVASDNCTPTASLTVTQSPAAGTLVTKGVTTITITVSDAVNNSTTCTTTFTVNDTTPPTITCPANIVKSTDPNLCSAVVTFTTTVNDNCPGATASCTPPSGSVFPKGTTTVTCGATDASGNASAPCSFTVTVNDTQPPAITCPANIVVEPTCPSGAVVTYTTPVGTDNCPGAVTTQTAGLASGSIFPIGTTTNTFKVTDTSGNFVTCSFTVRVKTAAEVVQDMISRVQALQPPLSGQQSQGLVSKLQAALDAINSGQTNVACNKLNDFISQVTAYINNGTLTSAQGQPLINSAAHVRNTLGCTALGCS